MTRVASQLDSNVPDGQYQDQVLPHVSRTFALTIPQLPMALRSAVTNAYLLCRIADTIEDEPAIAPAATLALLQRFVAVVHGHPPRRCPRNWPRSCRRGPCPPSVI